MRVRAELVLLTAAGLAVQSCKGTPTSVKPPTVELSCVRGILPVDDPANGNRSGDLTPAGGCRARDRLTAESTFTDSYVLPVQAGQGYLVLMWPTSNLSLLKSRLELVSADATGGTLLAGSRIETFGDAVLLFASTTTGTDTIRATTANAAPSDTGSYGIVARSCTMPVPLVTDSITHSDRIGPGDCEINIAAFDSSDHTISNLHLYALRMTDNSRWRKITFTGATPLRVIIGGPHQDTFGVTGGSEVAYTTSPDTATSFYFSGRPGDYTLVIGTDQYLMNRSTYTLTIGPEQPLPIAHP